MSKNLEGQPSVEVLVNTSFEETRIAISIRAFIFSYII